MKHLFSCLMVFSWFSFYSIQGMENGALATLAAVATVKSEFDTFKENLQLESSYRTTIWFHQQQKQPYRVKETKKKMQKPMNTSRKYIADSLKNPNLEMLQQIHSIFSTHITSFITSYKETARATLDQELLTNLDKTIQKLTKETEEKQLSVLHEDNPDLDLTKSMACISLFQQTSFTLKNLPYLKAQKMAELKKLEEQEEKAKLKSAALSRTLQQKNVTKQTLLQEKYAKLDQQNKDLEAQLAARNQLAQEVTQLAQSQQEIEKTLATTVGEFELVGTGDDKTQA